MSMEIFRLNLTLSEDGIKLSKWKRIQVMHHFFKERDKFIESFSGSLSRHNCYNAVNTTVSQFLPTSLKLCCDTVHLIRVSQATCE